MRGLLAGGFRSSWELVRVVLRREVQVVLPLVALVDIGPENAWESTNTRTKRTETR